MDRPGLSRRGLLLGLAALPIMAGARVAEATTDQAGRVPILGDDQFPIGAIWPPPPSQTTPRRYQQLKDAGFTFLITGNYLDDGYIVTRALDIADAVGLKVIVRDDHDVANLARWFTITDDRSVPMSISTRDAHEMASRAVRSYAAHQSFAGFDVLETPSRDSYRNLAAACTALRGVNSHLLRYVNLPAGNGLDYQRAILDYVRLVDPQLLSCNRSPLLAGGEDIDYVANLADLRAVGRQTGLPVWANIQTVGFDGHRSPSAADLLWQVNMALAYGAKGAQFFTYWTPPVELGGHFQPAMIDSFGYKTARYHAVQQINTDWLACVGGLLRTMTSESVVHANENARFEPDQYVTGTSGSPVVLSRFVDRAGQRWLLVVNRSSGGRARASLRLRCEQVSQFDPSSGELTPQRDTGGISVALSPGAAVLYRLS